MCDESQCVLLVIGSCLGKRNIRLKKQYKGEMVKEKNLLLQNRLS